MECITYFKLNTLIYKWNSKSFASLMVLCLSVLMFITCDLFTPNPFIQMVAKSIDIDPQWRVIKPESPLEVVNQVQSITIEIPDISSWQINGKDKSFIGPDGSIVKIDMELITKDGKSFKMNTIGLGPGLTFSYLPDGKNLVKESRFPRKMVFEKIRIRANRKITGGEVKWICTTNY